MVASNSGASSASRIVQHDRKTVEEFLHELLPTGSVLSAGQGAKAWVFRGHGDAAWRLVPSARRTKEEGLPWSIEPKTNREQIQKEIEAINRFFFLADRHGHRLPEDSQVLRDILHQLTHPPSPPHFGHENALKNWPTSEVLSLVGLAQHHGVPTQLLDWTWSSLCAAYFAAQKAAQAFKAGRKEGQLSVWALSTSLFANGPAPLPGDEPDRLFRVIEMVTVPTASNSRLHAQEGLFVWIRTHAEQLLELDAPVARDGLKEVVESARSTPAKKGPILVEFTLPRAEAPRLLRMLAELGASAGKFEPTLQGVTAALDERETLWDDPFW